MRQMIGLATLSGVLVLIGSGCSKGLTPSHAVSLTQRFLDAQPNLAAGLEVPVGELRSLVERDHVAPLELPLVRKLLQSGHIREEKVLLSYPNLGGAFTGTHFLEGYGGRTEMDDSFEFVVDGSVRPPRIGGSFKECMGQICWSGTASGEVAATGPSVITLAYEAKEDFLSERRVTRKHLLTVSLERGQVALLTGTLQNLDEQGRLVGTAYPIRLAGPLAPDIAQDAFRYRWTEKTPERVRAAGMLLLGKLQVDSCGQLLLVGNEIQAKGVCQAHAELSREAMPFWGGSPTNLSLEVQFAKQPDGGWTAVNGGFVSRLELAMAVGR